MTELRDKTALVTGASAGIGEATARALGAAGVKVALAARRTDRLKKIAAEISPDPNQTTVCTMDVTSRESVNTGVASILDRWGQIDILVNNAGIMPLSFIRNLKVDEWLQMVDVNINGVMYCTASVLPSMLESKSGHIVNISSVAGRRVLPSGSVYCGTKFFVNAFSEGLRMELSPEDNIRVTIIEPAMTESELRNTITDQSVLKRYESMKNITILEADDIARSIVYAVSQPPHVNVNEILIRPTEQAG